VNGNQTIGGLLASAWSDPKFAQALLDDADRVLEGFGLARSPAIRVLAKANTSNTVHLVLSGPPHTQPGGIRSDIRRFGETYRGDPRLWSLNWRARDPVARQRIVDDPRGELAKIGVECQSGIEVVMLVNARDLVHLVIPEHPGDACSPKTLEQLSAGHVPEALRFGRLFGSDTYSRVLQRLDIHQGESGS
jgi:hypothetical protein